MILVRRVPDWLFFSKEFTTNHCGVVVSISGQSILMTHDDGTPQDSHSVAATATITLDGKPAKLTDLKAGMHVELTGDPATSVVACCKK